MAIHLSGNARNLDELVQLEMYAFAAKIRLARAVLGWSQTELARHVGLTQRAIHKLEQGETEPRRTTVQALEAIWREQDIEFEDLVDGSFRATVRSSVFHHAAMAKSPRRRAAGAPRDDRGRGSRIK